MHAKKMYGKVHNKLLGRVSTGEWNMCRRLTESLYLFSLNTYVFYPFFRKNFLR